MVLFVTSILISGGRIIKGLERAKQEAFAKLAACQSRNKVFLKIAANNERRKRHKSNAENGAIEFKLRRVLTKA